MKADVTAPVQASSVFLTSSVLCYLKKRSTFRCSFFPQVRNADTEVKCDFYAFKSSADDSFLALLCLFRKKYLFLCNETVFEYRTRKLLKDKKVIPNAKDHSRSKHNRARKLLKVVEELISSRR